MKIQIKSIGGSILFECDAESVAKALIEAVKSRANLSSANLSGANLSSVDLYGVDLYGVDLYGANLSGANLSGVNLSGANLSSANLSGANLSGANLSSANLSRVDLYGANLSGANLSSANLSGANLSSANLSGAKYAALHIARTVILPEGALIGWKKCRNAMVKVRIPEAAKRSNSTGRKCRAEFVEVLEVIGEETGISIYMPSVTYKVGETVKCDKWNEDRWTECGGGIHFYLTREEAEAHV